MTFNSHLFCFEAEDRRLQGVSAARLSRPLFLNILVNLGSALFFCSIKLKNKPFKCKHLLFILHLVLQGRI